MSSLYPSTTYSNLADADSALDGSGEEMQNNPSRITGRPAWLEQLLDEQQAGWRQHCPPTIERLVESHPALQQDAGALLDLITQEFVCRLEQGEHPESVEYAKRFPHLRDQLAIQFALLNEMSPPPDDTVIPSKPMTLAAGAVEPVALPRIPGYRLINVLGRGGMGVVFRAYQIALRRVVAVKMLRIGGNGAERDRFMAEAIAAGRLQHPNIVQIFAIDQFEGAPYLALEYVPGGSLDKHLAGVPVDGDVAARIVETLARAIHYAHERGIVHRDLKPANILLAGGSDGLDEKPQHDVPADTGFQRCSGTPKIADFGLAKLLAGQSGATSTGMILGTPSYMSPEQATGEGKRVGPTADVYALGAILYECLTGRPPFRANSAALTVWQVQHEEPVSPRRLVPGIPADLQTICLKCLEKSPDRRYASAQELADDLKRFLSGESIAARPAGALEMSLRWARRRPLVAGLLAALAAVILGATVVLTCLWREAESARGQAVNQAGIAKQAAAETRRRLAQVHLQAAQLQMRQGGWNAALAELEAALESGHDDPIEVGLLQVRALEAMHQPVKAQLRIDELLSRKATKATAGPLLLLRGELLLSQKADDDAALQLVREALEKHALPPADQAYAQALLAPSSLETARHLEAALQSDPFHHHANSMLCLVLVVQGRWTQASQRTAVGEMLFPDDPTFKVYRAIEFSAAEKLAEANQTLDQLASALAPDQLAAARNLVATVHQVRQLGPTLRKVAGGQSGILAMAQVVPPLMSCLTSLSASRQNLHLPVPPVLVRAMSQATSAIPGLVLGGTSSLDALQRASALHPDAFFQILIGMSHVSADRWTAAERSFQAARDQFSFLPVDDVSLYCLACAQWMQTIDETAPGRIDRLKNACQNVRELVESRRYDQAQAAALCCIACDAGDYVLARWIADSALVHQPRDLKLLRQSLRIAYRSDNFSTAVRLADAILAEAPGDASATRVRELAHRRLSGNPAPSSSP